MKALRGLRRTFLKVSALGAGQIAGAVAVGQVAEVGEQDSSGLLLDLPECERCGGMGLVPLENRRPYVHVEGKPRPKPEEAVPGAACGACNADRDAERLMADAAEQGAAAEEFHATWEERYGRKLILVQTRHAALHTLLDGRESQRLGLALETLCGQLQKVTGSMALTVTRPDDYNLFVLWERPSWVAFRALLEKHFTLEQLGEPFANAGQWIGYDHRVMPHFYETKQTLPIRPPVHGVLSFFGMRQIQTATGWKAPVWLAEGFAAACEYIGLRNIQWYHVYDSRRPAKMGDSMPELRRLAAADGFRPFEKFLTLDLRDYDSDDFPQAFGLVWHLLHRKPSRLPDFVRLLRQGRDQREALEAAFGSELPALEQQWLKWAATAK